MKILTFSEYKLMPWKNGQGMTHEIMIFPANANLGEMNFDFRLSMAEINGENHFSQFPHYQRILTVVSGDGITFNLETIRHLEIKKFSGELAVHSRPLGDKKIIDLGIIYNEKIKTVEMETLYLESEQQIISHSDYMMIIPISDAINANEFSLNKLDTLILNQQERIHLKNNSRISLILIKINL